MVGASKCRLPSHGTRPVLSPCKEGADTSHRMPMGRWQAALVALVCPWGGGSWDWPVIKAGFGV